MEAAPPPTVCHAFGTPPEVRLLPGGSGGTWLAGDVILKPADGPRTAVWTADLFSRLEGPGFRVPRPLRARDGSWLAEGWVAWERVDGEPSGASRWPELVAVSRAFHRALAGEPRPAWLRRRTNPWILGDRVAWAETSIEIAPELAGVVAGLIAARRPLELPDQLIHGDIGGNVLFAGDQPPAVIDFSPYWRPAGFPVAVAAVDLLCWSGAPAEILDELDGEPDIDQLLLRALIYRLVTDSLFHTDPGARESVLEACGPVAELILRRVRGESGPAPDRSAELAAAVAGALGRPVRELIPWGDAGQSPADRRLANLDGGTRVFVKAAGRSAARLLTEIEVYEQLGPRPFLPHLLAVRRHPEPVLVLEDLAAGGWGPAWTGALVGEVQEIIGRVHALPAPAGLPRVGEVPLGANPWPVIAVDPWRMLRLHVCRPDWLDAHLPALREAAESAELEGDSLLHLDVAALNVWRSGGRVLLADWGSAAIGNPWLDRHLWAVALRAEGGPEPGAGRGPGAAGHAALIAGQQPLLTPSRDSNPVLFDLRRRRLAVAIAWAARELGLPPPEPPPGVPPVI